MSNVKYVLLNRDDTSDNVLENQNQSAFKRILAFVKHKQFVRFLAFCVLITTMQMLHMRFYYDERKSFYETTIQIDVEESKTRLKVLILMCVCVCSFQKYF